MLNMQTDLLRTFLSVADLRSFTKAGALLGRTQPAISLQIRRLEEVVRKPLFERESASFRLTPDGELLAGYARQILLLHDEAVSRLLRPVLRGVVHVGLPNDFAVVLLPAVLADFAAMHPEVELALTCEISVKLLQELQNGRLDVVVAMTAEQSAPAAVKLWREPLVWITGRSPGIEHTRPLPLIAYPEGCIYRMRMSDALSRAGIPCQIACTTASLSGLRAALHSGLGVTVLSINTVSPELTAVPLEAGLPQLADATVGIYYAPERLSEAAQHLLNFLLRRIDNLPRRNDPARGTG